MKAKVRRKKNKIDNACARDAQGAGKASNGHAKHGSQGKWVSLSEVSRRLQCARLTVRLRVKDGTIPGGTEFLGHLRLDRKTFENWLKSQPIGND